MPTKLVGSIAALIEDESRVIIETEDGSHVSLVAPKTTKILRNDQRAKLGDLQVGDHVSVVYLPGPRKAVEIRASLPGSKRKWVPFGA